MKLQEGIRAAILANTTIVDLLGDWSGAPSVHTRKPVPSEAGYPLVVISTVLPTDQDYLSKPRPLVTVDVAVYGKQPDQYRDTEIVAWAIRDLFHRKPRSISVEGYHIVSLAARGPFSAPGDDESVIGRAVLLAVLLEPTS